MGWLYGGVPRCEIGLKKTPESREFHGRRILIRIVRIIMRLVRWIFFALAQTFLALQQLPGAQSGMSSSG